MYSPCGHKTIRDHRKDGRWVCSGCGKVDAWTNTWGYHGNIECRKCQSPQIDFVYCSDECKSEYGKPDWLEKKIKISSVDASKPEPMPAKNDSTPIVELVKAAFDARSEAEYLKYGMQLQANNGRDALMDAFQEACDLVMYLMQAMEERRILNEKG